MNGSVAIACPGSVTNPSFAALRIEVRRSALAAIVLDGMQSQRWAAPPITSRSTIVTRAPSRAAYVAAVLPAGPPPTIRKRVVTITGYVSRRPAVR